MNKIVFDLVNRIDSDLTGGALSTGMEVAKSFIELVTYTRESELKEKVDIFAITVLKHAPTMATVKNFLNEISKKCIKDNIKYCKDSLITHAKSFLVYSKNALEKSAIEGEKLISNGDIIFAYSFSKTVLNSIFEAVKKGKFLHVISSYSYITSENKEMINLLMEREIAFDVYPEIALEEAIYRSNKILVGADCITNKGFVINKLGTHLASIIAKEEKKHFFVLTQSLKISPFEDIILRKQRIKLNNKVSYVPLFDKTPIDLVEKIATERGIFDSEKARIIFYENQASRFLDYWWKEAKK